MFDCLFRNRETGAITIAQWPNLVLWTVIFAAVLLWIWPSAGKASLGLTIIVKGGLIIWGADEIIRGVNPWRRCLGAAVIVYQVVTLLP
nr:hypothetical protein [Bradyrhizobium diazoefficiens]